MQLRGPGETDQEVRTKAMALLDDKLTGKDKEELTGLLGGGYHNPVFKDVEFDAAGLAYGLSVLASRGLYGPTPDVERQTVCELLTDFSPDALRELISHTWDYHTQQALAGIDLLAQDIYINDPHRGKITTYDFIRERSAHFEASRIHSKSGALALQAYQAPILERQNVEASR